MVVSWLRLESEDEALSPGQMVAGRYRIGERLGAGAIGTVYYAEHVEVGRPVAIKVLSRKWLGHDPMVERFRSEARAASAAGHPNIVDVLDAGDLDNGVPYLVMEHLAGRELYDDIKDTDGMPPRRAAAIARDVARALAAAHDKGIIHRDLKAENVMLVDRGADTIVKVLDFGIAFGVTERRMTTPGTFLGTPEYIAPEQVRGAEPTDRIDVYALGVLMHEMLLGRPPFEAAEPMDVLAMKTAAAAPSVAGARVDIPERFAALVDACLQREPTQRPSAREVIDILEEVLDSGAFAKPVSAPPASSRRGAWVVAVAVGVVAIAAVAYVLVAEPAASLAVAIDVAEPPPVPPLDDEPEPTPEPEPATSTTGADASTGTPEVVPQPPPEDLPKRPAKHPTTKSAVPDPPKPDPTDCGNLRARALEARDLQDWRGVLRYTTKPACFASALERKRLRVKAYLESGDYRRCIEHGESSSDAEIAKNVAWCRKKRAAK